MLCSVLRSLVDHSGKTQKEIALTLGLSQQRFNFYVNGTREPDAEVLVSIADYFHVTTDYLLGRSEQKEKPTPVSKGEPSDEELINLWKSLSPDEILRMKDFALGMIANRKKPPFPSD